MADQIPKAVKSERGREVSKLESELKLQYFQSLVGEQLQILIEKIDSEGIASGTSCRYAPIRAFLPDAVESSLVDVKIESASDFLTGRSS